MPNGRCVVAAWVGSSFVVLFAELRVGMAPPYGMSRNCMLTLDGTAGSIFIRRASRHVREKGVSDVCMLDYLIVFVSLCNALKTLHTYFTRELAWFNSYWSHTVARGCMSVFLVVVLRYVGMYLILL